MSNLLKKASILTTPTAYGNGVVNSIIPNTADGDFQFSRNSFATRVNENGLIETQSNEGSELITNGDFETDSDWVKQSGWSISEGAANCDGTANNALRQNFSLPVGTLRIKFDVTVRTQGSVDLWVNKPAFTRLISVDAIGSYEVDVVTASGADNVFFYSASNFIGSIDNISVTEVIQSDIPRIDYTNGCGELLLEGQSTNLVTYSEDFQNYFNVTEITLNSDYAISPDGTQNANKITFPSASNSMYKSGLSLSGAHTVSFYVKAENDNIGKTFDVKLIGTSVTQNIDVTLTNDWIRFEAETDGLSVLEITNRSSTTIGAGGSLLLFGFQLEALSYPTSYIPTNGATVTRAAESLNNAGNSDLINSEEGVLYCEIAALVDSTSGGIRRLSLSDGTNDNRIQILFTNTVGKISVVVKSGGLFQIDTGFSGYNTTDLNKIAIRYGSGVFKVYINGLSVFNDAGVSFSSISLDDLRFSNPSGSELMFARCKSVAVFKEALSDTELASLTTI